MSQFAFDVSIEEFEAKVLVPSETVPVVVDFWAPWCEPCKVLKPMLEKLAEEYGGRFLLAKINSDENPEIAQHFGVRSIPTVKVLFKGELVDELTGALPEGQIRAFLDKFALPPQPGSNLREEAAALVTEGKLEEALAKLVEASKAKPEDQAIQLDAVVVLLQLGRNDEAGQLLGGDYVQEPERANALRARLALTAGAADTAELEAKLAANPDNHAVRLDLSRAYAAQGKYREATEILNKLVYAEPDNVAAKDLLADVFEQIGYQKESPSVRNSFLAAAYELRHGMPAGASPKGSGPDVIRGMSTELWLNFLAISMDSKKADGMKFVINLVTPDNGEKFVVEMSNSALTNIKGHQAAKPDLTITLNRADLNSVMGGTSTFDDLLKAGKAKFDGDRKPFDQLRSILTRFTPDFELIPGTKAPKAAAPSKKDPFEAHEPADTSGG